MSRSLFFLLVAGCAVGPLADGDPDGSFSARLGTCEPWGGSWAGVIFNDQEATNVIAFVDHATPDELHAVAEIGSNIARRIIDARPFATEPDPMAALDAVPYVDRNVLDSLRIHVETEWCADDDAPCCALEPVPVPGECETLGGVFSGVTFTDAQAGDVLEWANKAGWRELVGVCGVGESRAVDLVAARPLESIYHLDSIPNFGPATLHKLLGDPGYVCPDLGSVAEVWCGDPSGGCSCVVEGPGPLWSVGPAAPTPHGDLTRSGGVLLPDDTVMIAGGIQSPHLLDQVDAFDPVTQTWSTLAPLHVPRHLHTLTLLMDGRVLAAGGRTATAELFHPSSGSWAPVGSLQAERTNHTATLLANGRVLITGGSGLATAELYDPDLDAFLPTGSMTRARDQHQAVRLGDDRVLVLGYANADADLYHPGTGVFSVAAPPPTELRQAGMRLATLADGRAMLTGAGAAALFDPDSRAWTTAAPMPVHLVDHVTMGLPDGNLFVSGGWLADSGPTDRAFLYLTDADLWLEVDRAPRIHRVGATVMAGDGRVFAMDSAPLLFDPAAL